MDCSVLEFNNKKSNKKRILKYILVGFVYTISFLLYYISAGGGHI